MKKKLKQVQEHPHQPALNPTDVAVLGDILLLKELSKKGKKTKFQLLSMGLKNHMIANLVQCGILVHEYDPNTNLYYYKVNDERIDFSKRTRSSLDAKNR